MKQTSHTFDIVLSRAPNYPALCREFLTNAAPADEAIKTTIAVIHPHSQEGKLFLGRAAVIQKVHQIQASSFGYEKRFWEMIERYTPGNLLAPVTSRKLETLTEMHANMRAGHLMNFMKPEVLVPLLPDELRTAEAARYMWDAKRFNLAGLIQHGM